MSAADTNKGQVARVATSLAVGFTVGLAAVAAMTVHHAVAFGDSTFPTFWGMVFGIPAGAAAGAAALAVLGRGSSLGLVGRYALAAVLLLFGAAVTWWNVMWGMPLLRLEGAWLWPLATIPLICGIFVLRRARASRRQERTA